MPILRLSLRNALFTWGLALLVALSAPPVAVAVSVIVAKPEPTLEQRVASLEAYLANTANTATSTTQVIFNFSL